MKTKGTKKPPKGKGGKGTGANPFGYSTGGKKGKK